MDKLPPANIIHLIARPGYGKNYAIETSGCSFDRQEADYSPRGRRTPLIAAKVDYSKDIVLIDEAVSWDPDSLPDALSEIAKICRESRCLLVILFQTREEADALTYKGGDRALRVYLRQSGDADILAPAIKARVDELKGRDLALT